MQFTIFNLMPIKRKMFRVIGSYLCVPVYFLNTYFNVVMIQYCLEQQFFDIHINNYFFLTEATVYIFLNIISFLIFI